MCGDLECDCWFLRIRNECRVFPQERMMQSYRIVMFRITDAIGSRFGCVCYVIELGRGGTSRIKMMDASEKIFELGYRSDQTRLD